MLPLILWWQILFVNRGTAFAPLLPFINLPTIEPRAPIIPPDPSPSFPSHPVAANFLRLSPASSSSSSDSKDATISRKEITESCFISVVASVFAPIFLGNFRQAWVEFITSIRPPIFAGILVLD